jgi:hypothetical protein
MTYYTLYWNQPDEVTQTGETLVNDPLPLHLTYSTYHEAALAARYLETLYGADSICIDENVRPISYDYAGDSP